ncbi:hypothetical protein GCM10029992_36580 [Glycomyces albus]
MAEKQKTKSEQAIATIATFLYEHPGLHDLDAVKAATGLAGPMAGRALANLVDSKAVALDDNGGSNQWAWAEHLGTDTDDQDEDRANAAGDKDDPTDSDSQAEPQQRDGDTAAPDTEPEETETAAEIEKEDAESTTEAAGAESAPVAIPPALLDPDPMVMLMARVLAEAPDPLTTREVAEAAYMPMGTREVLTALRALDAQSLAVCSKPFAPDEEDCTWQRQTDLDADAFMRQARTVPMNAAPDKVTCPTCGGIRAIPGVTKPRKRGGDLRSDGSRKLPAGGLKKLAKEWLTKPENAGESVTPGQLKRELKADHGDLIGRNCDGALRQLMADQFTKEDPTDEDKRPLLVLAEGVTPITYRIRDAQ